MNDKIMRTIGKARSKLGSHKGVGVDHNLRGDRIGGAAGEAVIHKLGNGQIEQ
jgi:hypothetical protein